MSLGLNELMQKKCNSIANALKFRQSMISTDEGDHKNDCSSSLEPMFKYF